MKTPMQELRHEIEVWLDVADENLVFAYKSVLEAIDESYLKKEKEVIMDAHIDGAFNTGWDEHTDVRENAQDYYNETFNTKEK